MLFGFNSIKDKTIKQFLHEVKVEVQEVYKHRDYPAISVHTQYSYFGFSYNKAEFHPAGFALRVNTTEQAGMELSLAWSEKSRNCGFGLPGIGGGKSSR